MPYVKQDVRDELQYPLDVINGHITDMLCSKPEDRAGILNYVITVLIDNAYGPLSGAKYKDYNEAIGMLECCKLEFYRKAAAPYEDLKEKENGKVLDGETRKKPIPYSMKITLTETVVEPVVEPSEFNLELFNTIKDRIIFELNHWNKLCKSEAIKLESDLYGIGLDRSDIITICCEFEHTFKIPMGVDQMEELKTVGDLYKYFNKSEK